MRLLPHFFQLLLRVFLGLLGDAGVADRSNGA